MFKLFRLGIIIASVLALAFLLACEGEQGPQGPAGDQGDPGDPGAGLDITPPDGYLSLAIFNQFDGEAMNYRAKDFIRITFDTTQNPSSTLIVGAYVPIPPKLDGEDGDIDEWGNGDDLYESDIDLTGIVGDNNFISEVSVRCVYDAENIYFFLTWIEDDNANFQVGGNRNLLEWSYEGFQQMAFVPSGSEDRAWLLFMTDPEFIPEASYSLLENGLGNASLPAGSRVDAWDWRASLTDPIYFCDDGYFAFNGGLSDMMGDAGGAPFIRNINETVPAWMAYNDPNANADYPFWFRNAKVFVEANFARFATIPGYMAVTPYGDRADVSCGSFFEQPRWIVEIKRARNTGSGNDVQF